MPITNLNRSDIWFTTDGDFLTDGTGDIRDTDSGDTYESLKQTVLHRIIGNQNGWRFNHNLTAGLERYIGRSINDDLIQSIEHDIRQALTVDGNLLKSDFIVKVLEITPGDLAILLYINAVTVDTPVLTFAYHIKTGSITRVR